MTKQIVIAEQHRIAAVFSEDQIQELVVATGSHQVSDIYLGIVENVLPGIDAAFVNIGDPERNGFMHVTDLGPLRLKRSAGAITELLTPQQKVLVQVMKEPTGSKGPRLTGNITLPGRYLVLMPYGRGVNLSRRIKSEAERNRLRALAILVKPAGMGLLVRTEAEGMTEEAIMEDLEVLQKQWESVQIEGGTTRAPALLNRDDDFIQRVLRDMFSGDVNRIVVDSQNGIKRVKQQLMSWNGGKLPAGVLIDHHRERASILEFFRVNAAIREALRPRVDLPSGGYVIIEPTEALTVIDVNSGSFTRSATARETVLWTNCEAATEIARQLRLRNIAGVIIVDFIDMESRRDQLQVLEHFNKALRADKARPQIAQLSELGLVELTRKRQGQNIYELFGHSCPTCNGLGHLVQLPGEDEMAPAARESGDRTVATSNRVLLNLPEGLERRSLAPVATASPTSVREERLAEPQRAAWEPQNESLDFEAGSNVASLDLLNHPSYQDLGNGTRRRRRRRIGEEAFGLPVEEEPVRSKLRLPNTSSAPIAEPRAEYLPPPGIRPASEGFGLVNMTGSRREDFERVRPTKSELMKPMVEPPEVITVEMTAEEQDVYAVMGVSPLVLTNRSLKNPKNAIVSVTMPGEAPTKPPFEQLELEFTPAAQGSNVEERDYYAEMPVVESVFSPVFSEDAETEIYDESLMDDDTDDFEPMSSMSSMSEISEMSDGAEEAMPSEEPILSEESMPSEEPIPSEEPEEPAINRRRRRRSSAVLDE
ncbi:MAG: Rne/Rng family ribonuclease [Oscillatoriales cyanobacterium]|uniref:Rne/Rng family ribonuclease n=1 Tax=Microcoleus anatoxicus PTRS2 TaxID=2705321 RepID=A0ABU8YLI5_9CYAN|nr:MAG: Rne/Rng family ribonuclease [Oscillatoriales cyanobacterium]TAD97012.1 MAG: Rne/Rng family ribonuclease [Oscillatoriales cyanobacterium]TAE01016.1 MAG: Rne/Rng family ribonuclease [Oscillatoriales cyanobacterium]TAF05100.1 MAG: Rne/Rng family ribonuclease [Oscillatoriales cyanobacterium]TAF33589.1 MAG: Rne/Rng family ribonuclease [Oscillatoriales cyanobacterium]